jgi:uncharacterized metal-binding protein YceD (DUF177 family)
MDKFRLNFRGLAKGTHDFEFQITDEFFAAFPESEVKNAEIKVKAELIVTNDLLTFNFKLKGKVNIQCDRCLEYFYLPIKYKTTLYVESGDYNSDLSDADDTIMISHKENEIVLDKHFYDYIHLSLPIQKIHPDDENGNSTCDPEMLKKLESSEFNEMKTINPEWDKLKDLYN